MTAPVQEPTQGRMDQAQEFRVRQLFRRPAPSGVNGPGVIILTNVAQPVASLPDKYSGGTTIEFDTVSYESADSEGMIDLGADPTTITIIRDGIYFCTGVGLWEPSTDTAYRRIYALGGTDQFEARNQGDAVNSYVQASHGFAPLVVGDTITLLATQSSGVSQDIIGANMQAQWVGPFDGIYGPRF